MGLIAIFIYIKIVIRPIWLSLDTWSDAKCHVIYLGETTLENIGIPSVDITLICHMDSCITFTLEANPGANVLHILRELCAPSQ